VNWENRNRRRRSRSKACRIDSGKSKEFSRWSSVVIQAMFLIASSVLYSMLINIVVFICVRWVYSVILDVFYHVGNVVASGILGLYSLGTNTWPQSTLLRLSSFYVLLMRNENKNYSIKKARIIRMFAWGLLFCYFQF
jgi:hypothetical protein